MFLQQKTNCITFKSDKIRQKCYGTTYYDSHFRLKFDAFISTRQPISALASVWIFQQKNPTKTKLDSWYKLQMFKKKGENLIKFTARIENRPIQELF